MSDLTISVLQDIKSDVTLYQVEAEGVHYAMLGDAGMDEDRLHDLLLGSATNGSWKDYFSSTWYPLVYASSKGRALEALIDKVRTVRCKEAERYIHVLITHSWFIHDNFNAGRLCLELDNAWNETVGWPAA